MVFELVHFSHTKEPNGESPYRSHIHHGNQAGHRTFQSKDEMVQVLQEILESQKGYRELTDVLLEHIENGSYQFSGREALDLTEDQAESLGWKGNKKTTLSDAG